MTRRHSNTHGHVRLSEMTDSGFMSRICLGPVLALVAGVRGRSLTRDKNQCYHHFNKGDSSR
jgi:hypothetical protein